MPTGEWILIAAIVVLVLAVVIVGATVAKSRKKTERLKHHFGDEYERTVSEAGDPKAAEKELITRERRRDKLDIAELSPSARADFANRWEQVQTAFVDDPAGAVGTADRLVTEVMRERGYPVDDFDQQAATVSVDHPHIVDNYRAGHAIYLAQQSSTIGTEQQREAFVHYRALFEKLLETDRHDDEAQEASA